MYETLHNSRVCDIFAFIEFCTINIHYKTQEHFIVFECILVASMLPLPGDIPLPQPIHRPHGILKKSTYFEKYVGFMVVHFSALNSDWYI